MSVSRKGYAPSKVSIEKMKETRKKKGLNIPTDKTLEKLRIVCKMRKYGNNRALDTYKHSTETIEKIRKSLIGRKQSIETIERIRKANLGKKDSEITRRKKSLSAMSGWIKRRQKQ